MRAIAERKLRLIHRIDDHRGRLVQDLGTLRDDVGWFGGLLGGIGAITSLKPRRWKSWMRVLTVAPIFLRLLRRLLRRRGR